MSNHTRIAYAIVILQNEPATTGVLHALTLLENALPVSGTLERRDAFQEAHALYARKAA